MRLNRLRATLAGVLITAVVGTGLAFPALGDELDDARRQTEAAAAAAARAQEELEHELEETDAALAQAYLELKGIEDRIPGAEAELAAAEETLARLQREAAIIAERLVVAEAEEVTITGEIAEDTARAEQIRMAIGQMARDAYKGDMAATSMSAVLDAHSTEEFVEQSALASTALRTQTQALSDLEQINGVNRNRQARLTAVREQIVSLKAEADAKVVEAEAARAEAEARKVELERLRAEQQEKAALIESQKQAQLAKQAELVVQQTALANRLADIIKKQEAERLRLAELERQRLAEEARRRAAEQNKPAPPAPPPASLPPGGMPSRGVLSYPTPSPVHITSHYGWRIHPIYGYGKLHAGTDFRAYCGNPIIAAASGTVQWAQGVGGFGNQVMLNHGYSNNSSLMTSYNHLTSFAVRSGQTVSAGQVLGYSGNTGTSTACHLHFEVYVNGSTVDPMTMF